MKLSKICRGRLKKNNNTISRLINISKYTIWNINKLININQIHLNEINHKELNLREALNICNHNNI